jgi:hypothetical protein
VSSGAYRYAGVDVHVSGLPDALYVLRRPSAKQEWTFLGHAEDVKRDRPRLGVPADVWAELMR